MINIRPHKFVPPTFSRSLNGSSDYIDLKQPAALNFANNSPISIELWVNVSGATGVLVGGGYSGGNTAYELSYSAGNLQFHSYNGSSHGVLLATGISYYVWHHLYADYDGAAWHFYIDGAIQGTSVDAIGPISVAVNKAIGAQFQPGIFAYHFGKYSRVTFRNLALKPAEVAQLYAGVSPARVRNGAGLVYWWQPKTIGGPDIDLIGGNVATVNGTTGANWQQRIAA